MNRKIVILNGDPEATETPLNTLLKNLKVSEESTVKIFNLRNYSIKQCVGCFDCWLKTPGICRFKDDEEMLLREIITSDLLIFTSPLIMGMYSALLKRFQDRMIPIIHPYIEIVNNECHHRKRYPKYPKMGCLFYQNDATPEEIENIRFIHERIVLNIHSELVLFESVNTINQKEFSHAISHI